MATCPEGTVIPTAPNPGGVRPNPRKFCHAKLSLVTMACSLQCAGDLANFPYFSR